MNTKSTRKGFTTVELVIVIAVIAILATVLIPTFSNMIEKANLSVDTQNVRNMNMVLLTHMFDEAEDFGSMKAQLVEGGYGKDANFIPKTKGYKYYWYVDKVIENGIEKDISVILLVNENGDAPTVEYPEEYTNVSVNTLSNPYVCFDLSLPAATVTPNGETNVSLAYDLSGTQFTNLPLAVSYTFVPASDESSKNYKDWYADFYITFDKDVSNVTLAGFYAAFSPDYWLVVSGPVSADNELAIVQTVDNSPWTYEAVQTLVKEFKCGVADEVDGAEDGATMTVELRLTNPEDPTDIKVLGIFEYEFK